MSHTPVPEKIQPESNVTELVTDLLIGYNDFVDWAHSIEKRMGEQPSEVVRPTRTTLVSKYNGEFRLEATYPTREAAEAARKMLLGE